MPEAGVARIWDLLTVVLGTKLQSSLGVVRILNLWNISTVLKLLSLEAGPKKPRNSLPFIISMTPKWFQNKGLKDFWFQLQYLKNIEVITSIFSRNSHKIESQLLSKTEQRTQVNKVAGPTATLKVRVNRHIQKDTMICFPGAETTGNHRGRINYFTSNIDKLL